MISNLDGDVYGHVNHECLAPGGQQIRGLLPIKESCKEFRIDVQLSRRLHKYFIGKNKERIVGTFGPTGITIMDK